MHAAWQTESVNKRPNNAYDAYCTDEWRVDAGDASREVLDNIQSAVTPQVIENALRDEIPAEQKENQHGVACDGHANARNGVCRADQAFDKGGKAVSNEYRDSR